MFSWLKLVMARRAVRQAQALKVQRALLEQARQARTVRQALMLEHLAVLWLPASLRLEVRQALKAALVQGRMTGFPRSTASPKRTGKSTSRHRRAR